MTHGTQRAFATAIAAAALALACSSTAPAPTEPPHPARMPEPRIVPDPEAVAPTEPQETHLSVIATAYNSVPSQGVGRGTRGAWGDRLVPGMKTIAVSHDLLALGLTRGMKVRIDGLEGHFIVLDRLPRRWNKRIDIYMGKDVRAARAWGRREVQIRWEPSAVADLD